MMVSQLACGPQSSGERPMSGLGINRHPKAGEDEQKDKVRRRYGDATDQVQETERSRRAKRPSCNEV